MKKILIFIYIIFCSILFAQNGNEKADLKVRYYMVMAPDSTLLKNQNEASVFSYALLFNAKRSLYADENAKAYYDYLHDNAGKYGVLSIR